MIAAAVGLWWPMRPSGDSEVGSWHSSLLRRLGPGPSPVRLRRDQRFRVLVHWRYGRRRPWLEPQLELDAIRVLERHEAP